MKPIQKLLYIAFIVAIALSVLLPGPVSAATKAKPKPIFSAAHTPGPAPEYFVTKNGVLVNIATAQTGGVTNYDITTVTPQGKVSKFSEKSPKWPFIATYATNEKGKEVIYILNSETKKVKALNLSLKKIWEVKLNKLDTYSIKTSKEDGSIQISSTEKLTIDGKVAKVKKTNPAVKRIGKYEYRVNEKAQTFQKTDKETGKVLWNKRIFDLEDKDGKTIAPANVRFAFFDDQGNAYAAVTYQTFPDECQLVAVSKNGEIIWSKKGHITPGEIVGDVLYYYHEEPMIMDGYNNDYDIIVVNKNTGKTIRTYGPAGPAAVMYDLTIRGNNLYVAGETVADVINSKGKVIVSYKSPKGRAIASHHFDNKNNFYIQSSYNPGMKDQNGWIFTYSEKGKLISKKSFDQKNYDLVLIDPSGKQHYQVKKVKGKNNKETIEFYTYK